MPTRAGIAATQDWGTIVVPSGVLLAGWQGGLPGRLNGPARRPSDDGGSPPSRSLNILMVEDDEALAQMYAMRLRKDGHQVTMALDGEKGLKEAIEGAYDLVFLDISLPRLDGLSLLERMRKSATASDRPVVILSNYNEPPLLARGKALGVKGYLVKSEVSPSQIAAGLRGWLD